MEFSSGGIQSYGMEGTKVPFHVWREENLLSDAIRPLEGPSWATQPVAKFSMVLSSDNSILSHQMDSSIRCDGGGEI